jgi:hypothetical protein
MVGTLRREPLDRVLIVNERRLRGVVEIYLEHFNAARPHRSLGQLIPAQTETRDPQPINLAEHRIRRTPILTGLTSQYEREHATVPAEKLRIILDDDRTSCPTTSSTTRTPTTCGFASWSRPRPVAVISNF